MPALKSMEIHVSFNQLKIPISKEERISNEFQDQYLLFSSWEGRSGVFGFSLILCCRCNQFGWRRDMILKKHINENLNVSIFHQLTLTAEYILYQITDLGYYYMQLNGKE